VIHAFALDPKLVATWGRRVEFRFIHDKFGLGTPRVLLELPAFNKWKKAVYAAATEMELSQEDMKRIEELFRLLGECKCRRSDTVYDGLRTWLENAEYEFNRKPFAAIIAGQNPRGHRGVLVSEELGGGSPRWACQIGATPRRTPEALAVALSAMLMNCKQLHIIDPHFGPENARHRKVLEAMMNVLPTTDPRPKWYACIAERRLLWPFLSRRPLRWQPVCPLGLMSNSSVCARSPEVRGSTTVTYSPT
jgi:hypothetical protein